MLLTLGALATDAYGQVCCLGLTSLYKTYSTDGDYLSAVNTSIVVDPTGWWTAVEVETVADEDEPTPRLDLWQHLGHGSPASGWVSKTVSQGRLLNPTMNPDVGARMFPSITTLQGTVVNPEAFVYATGKENVTGHTFAHLETFRQDKIIFTNAASRSSLGGVPTDVEHGRPEIVEEAYPANVHHLCWTARTPAGVDRLDNLRSKGKLSGATWAGAMVHDISATALTEDHCSTVLDNNHQRFVAYHTRVGTNATTNTIRIHRDTFDPATGTWADGTDYALADPVAPLSGAIQRSDFPVIYNSGMELMVVAQDQTNNSFLPFWRCDIAATGCDADSDWTVGLYDPPGTVQAPQVALEAGSAYAVWESATGLISVARWCPTDSGFVALGTAMSVAGYTQYRFGLAAGNATRVFVYDETSAKLRAVFLSRAANLRGDAFHWEFDDPC